MEWQFRKTLQSFQNYKKTSDYKNEIEKGDSNLLKMCLREIEMIISGPKENITQKVLALRVNSLINYIQFVRDIMLLGRADVIQSTQRLVPYILKICSFKLQSADPNRGQSFFHQHPNYLKSSNEDIRKQINQLGSTYLILSLQSILHWAIWIPFDQHGNKSLYAKAYKDLIERGVNFPNNFHYYKQSDTEKFKYANKVECFTDSFGQSSEDITCAMQRKEKNQQISIDSFQQQELNVVKISSKPESNVKIGKSPKKQILKSTSTSQEFLKKQQKDPTSKIYELKLLIDQKQREIANLTSIHQKEKRELIQDYQRKIDLLKASSKEGNKENNTLLIIELQNQNDHLKKKLSLLETQLLNTNSTKLQQWQISANKFESQVSKLKIENQNLIAIINEKNKKEEQTKLQLESQRKTSISQNEDFIKKIQNLQSENQLLKQALTETNNIIDSKDMEIFNLKQELKRFQNKSKDLVEKKTFIWTQPQSVRKVNHKNPDEAISPKKQHYQQILSNKNIKYDNYQDLYLELKPKNKESFLRLCRSAFKKKDILFKQNELEIGIITETLSDNKVSFLLHLTNLAATQIENIKIEPLVEHGLSLHYEISLQNIFCIQPQEQEKVQCIVTNEESPLIKDRSVITVNYEKNGLHFSHNIFLPFMIPKFLVNSRPFKPPMNPRYLKEELIFQYEKKMLPRPSYIKSYFENTSEKIQNKKYEVELYHRETALSLYLTFSFEDNENLCIQSTVLREKINEKQKHIMEETLGFLQVAFKK